MNGSWRHDYRCKDDANKDCKKKINSYSASTIRNSRVDIYLITVIHTGSQPLELANTVILTIILVNTRTRASPRALGALANLLHFRQSVNVGLISNSFHSLRNMS
jgi:hypothetical protein